MKTTIFCSLLILFSVFSYSCKPCDGCGLKNQGKEVKAIQRNAKKMEREMNKKDRKNQKKS